MSPSPRRALLLGASLIVLAHPALAQDDSGTTVLGVIEITADAARSVALDGYVATNSQVATKSNTPLAESQQSVSVVTNQQIRDQGAANLSQALSYTAGVSSQPFGADPRADEPIVRGFSSSHAQYVNGLRQGRYFGATNYELYGMQQVEVLRGPSSSLYGAGSPVGVINLVQKRAQDFDFNEVGLSYGSNDSRKLFFDLNRVVSDDLSWRLTGLGSDIRQQVREVNNERGYLAGAVRWRPDDATVIDFMASYTKDKPISPIGLPYELTQTGDGDYLRDLYAGQSDWDDSDRTMWNLGLEMSHQMDNGWTLAQAFRYEKLDWDYTGTYLPIGATLQPDGTFPRGSSRQSERSESISLDTRLSGEMQTGAATHQLLFGVDIRKYDADESSHFGTAPGFDPRTGTATDGERGFAGTPNAGSVTLKQVGVYAQDEIVYDNWRGSLALRYDYVKQTGEQYGFESAYKENDLTGRAGLSYVFANGVMPYVSYSSSFDPQTGRTEDGRPLDPTTGRQWELGVKYQPAEFDALFTAAIYDLRQKNIRQAIGGNLYQQIGEVKSRGVELEATAELAQGWDIRAGYAYNDTEQVGGTNTGQPMPNAPRHTASLWLDRDFGNGLRVGGGVRYVGARDDTTNTHRLDDVTLVDLGASYTRDNIEASLNIHNLTDKTYVSTCSFFGCFYGEGRTVMATVAYKW
ncbi:iron complex outermembrane recepter protein [Paracoccus alcaliphilus]|uniref:Iron complex outermembrane recepter protein n=1 Tax=Paracoccus alcaliphilus TaxID=34002 RepID=A0A1H8F3C3_9RHOB|nr:TonB-dependent siderophore receptor [Paracoccus alcaliphilus]WCR20408.1 TonB-dependent siderophore receptor [Paracoccus alcaliphilus]SEN25508.1 iron complex outermembrane recepter protein [Paracoccus alcaliphilus]